MIPNYCDSTLAPLLANANNPAPYQTVNSTTYFTCNFGYQTTGSSAPFFTCNSYNSTNGIWSSITYSCLSIKHKWQLWIITRYVLNQIKRVFLHINYLIEIPIYCVNSTAPTLVNSTTATSPVLTVFDTTSFTCNMGLASTGGYIAPFYECLSYNSTVGQWSSINYTCNGINILSFVLCLISIKIN